MGKLAMILMHFFSIATLLVHDIDEGPQAVEEWFKNLSHKKEKMTKLHFYLHDSLTGKNPTAAKIAQAEITSTSKTFFGSTFMIDDPLTAGPELNSTAVGRAQGIYGSADLEKVGLLMNINFVFTTGEYNGSTLSLLGRQAVGQYREMPIVGGSGVFRLARGIATAQTYITTGDDVVEFNVIVLHY